MSTEKYQYQSDIRPFEFTFAVVVGGVGSAVLSSLHVNPLVSVGFALAIMGILAYLRWQVASQFKDFQSLEAFAEDIYLLGYLLTLSALLGLAPRLMSDDANLFNLAGLKLVTTVVGLAMMMIFRQIARRWSEEKEGETLAKFEEQQQLFSNAVQRLNAGADELTGKLEEVVRRFNPELLNPVAEWSNRAAGAFSNAAGHLEALPAPILKAIEQLQSLNASLEHVKSSSGELAGVLTAGTAQAANTLASELDHASRAANGLSVSVAAITPAGQAARDVLQKFGGEAAKSAGQFEAINTGLSSTDAELVKLHRALKKILDLHSADPSLPLNRLVEALDTSSKGTSASAEKLAALSNGLEAISQSNQFLAKKIEAATSETRSGASDTKELLVKLSHLQSELSVTNGHFKVLLARLDKETKVDHRPGFFRRITGA